VVINGIITFMLTPGAWITTGSFWDGFFNPTYWSSLVLRTGICIMLAGIYALVVASRYPVSPFKAKIVRYNAVWGLVGLAVMLPSVFWYFSQIPDAIMATAQAQLSIPMAAQHLLFWLTAILAAILIIFGLIIPKAYHTIGGIAVLALGLVWFGSYEWFRESVRKPYVITDYMYGNALELAHAGAYATDGLLAHMTIKTDDPGADLFRHACRSCHTIDGYNAIKPFYDGTDQAFIAGMVAGVGAMKGNMPPWMGTQEEAQLLAAHIYKEVDHRPISEIYGLSGIDLGRKVYDIRCGSCHEFGGFNDKFQSLVGLEREDYELILDMSDDLGEEMPAFTGSTEEREALIQFLMTLNEKEGGQA
jgi:mono/diheme cytochrome c family protein